MDDVVDLDEVLAAASEHVVGRELVRLEAVEVALVQVEANCSGRRTQPARLWPGRGDPGRVRDPHRLGHPEPLPHQAIGPTAACCRS